MERKKYITRGIALWIIIGLSISCNRNSLGLFTQSYPHEQYHNKLKDHGLSTSKMGVEWIESAGNSLLNAVEAEVPFSIKGLFSPANVEALSWKFSLPEGATVAFDLNWTTPDSSRVFMDVFKQNGDQWKYVTSAGENDLYLEHEAKETGQYLLRLQAELLANGQYELKIRRKPTYSVFPVQGKDGKAIWSIFGDPRDGGGRSHEGIDIFAERGTPVISPVKGRVSSVRNGGLGGKSVFIRDSKRGHSLYFAHLDSQIVSIGNMLRPGDTLGFVGNTGNAKHTAPHLHFGIYKGFAGAIDPYPFTNDQFEDSENITVDFPQTSYFVVDGSRANFRSGPGTEYAVIKELERQNIVFPKARNNNWYLVELPDHRLGYIHSSLLDLTAKGSPVQDSSLWVFWDPFTRPSDSISISASDAQILGNYNGYELLVNKDRVLLWKRS